LHSSSDKILILPIAGVGAVACLIIAGDQLDSGLNLSERRHEDGRWPVRQAELAANLLGLDWPM